jgi:hypothetical protein
VDLTVSAGQRGFLDELRAYLDGLPLDLDEVRRWYETDPMEITGPARAFVRRLGADGWLGMGWPVEYGGGGRSAVEQWLFLEELAYRRLPSGNLTTSSLGPVLARLGSDELRAEFLPGILAGDVDFGIGYSEPEAGTDLASLTTRAELSPDGDTYVVNGQKIYTTGAHVATHLWLAVRTGTREQRHRGLTVLIVPLPADGVEITPILTQGDERTNQVFLTDVRVPARYRVGAQDAGWTAITTQLNFERLFCHSDLRHQFDLMLAWARSSGRWSSPVVRASLAELAADLEVVRLFCHRAAWLLDHDRVPVAEASMNKVWYSELRQRLAIAALDVIGPDGQLRGAGPLDGRMERAYRASTVIKFGAGTNEVQRDIIARVRFAESPELDLDPELRQLRDATRAFLNSGGAVGDPKLWTGGLRLGWLSACAADPLAAGVVAAEIGRAGIGVPLLSTALAVELVAAADPSAAAWKDAAATDPAATDPAATGRSAAATTGHVDTTADLLATIEESGAVAAVLTTATATRTDDGWVLAAPATVVEWAAEAEYLVCLAEAAGAGGTTRLVAKLRPSAPGLTVTPVATMDHQPAAVVTLADVRVAATPGTAPAALAAAAARPAATEVVARPADPAAVDRALAVHRLLRAAELAGGALAVQEMTAEHVRRRHQFGVPLSSFQAVQHLFADLATHVDAALLAAWTGLTEAARDPDGPDSDGPDPDGPDPDGPDPDGPDPDGPADLARAAAIAPFVAGRAYLRAVTDGAQLHGGIGVSQDYPLHRYFQRAQAERLRLGALDDQLERIAGQLPDAGA